MIRRLALGLFLALLLAPLTKSASHPISLLWVEFLVHEDRVEAELVITVEEFYYVYELEPGADGALAEADVAEAMEKYKEYLLEHFEVYDMDGKRLQGVVKEVKLMSSEFALPMEREVAYKVEYPLEFPPAKLKLVQRFGGVDSAFPSVMTIEVEHVNYTLPTPFLLEKETEAVIEFDWLAPPLSEAMADPETLEEKRRELLGITSFGSIYTFFYVEETEVRHELLLPLATLETWVPIERKRPSVVTVEEQDAAIEAIFEFFSEHNPILVDGIEVKAQLERVDFFDLEYKDLATKPPRRSIPSYAARIGIILEYPTKGVPDEVQMTWDLFSRDVREVRTNLIAWEKGTRIDLTENTPTLTWKNPGRPPLPSITSIDAPPPPDPLRLPVVSVAALLGLPFVLIVIGVRKSGWSSLGIAVAVLVAVGAVGLVGPRVDVADPRLPAPEAPPVADADRILGSLHKNIYRAFDYRNESDIYDALGRSVDGELLSDLYLGIREGLEMQEQGGAVARVDTVEIEGMAPTDLANDVRDRRAFQRQVQWKVSGSVEHWGHIHSRTNRYDASFLVEPRDDAWKITGMKVDQQERMPLKTDIRKVL